MKEGFSNICEIMTVQEKYETDSTSKLQEHKRCTHSLKLGVSFWSFRWLSSSFNLVSNFKPLGPSILLTGLGVGQPIINKVFLKDCIVLDCCIL